MKYTFKKPTRKDIIKCSIAVVLYIAFLIWIQSAWGLIVLPLIVDNYITKFINWSWWKESESPAVRLIMSWVDALVFALVAVYFVNIYFFQNYTIPSSSLEKSLLIGDYLMVSKSSYGARVPQTPLHMPLCQHTLPFGIGKSYIEGVQWEYKRIHPERVPVNDIVVFNFPDGDSVLYNMQEADYYDFCYGYGRSLYAQKHGIEMVLDSISPLQKHKYFEECYNLGQQYISANPGELGEVIWRPVDRRENYVKRCVGTPGQTLEIKDRIVYLDGKANKEPDNVQYCYRVELLTQLPEDLVDALELSSEQLNQLYSTGCMPLTNEAYTTLKNRTDLVSSITMVPQPEDDRLFPKNGGYHWSCDNYGPLWIPEKGKEIPGGLTLENLPLYERIIDVYEDNDLKVTDDGKILINGKEAKNYTFKMDYYWMMGDNRHYSADSRFWGFVPEDHIVGKPVLIWFSKDPNKGLFNGIRWKRLFRWVDNIK